MLTDNQKRYMKKRRADLRQRGICVDCQQRHAKPGTNRRGKPHTCCEICLQARRDRWAAATDKIPPLFKAIAKIERIH